MIASFKMKPYGMADLAASSALDAAMHRRLSRDDIRLEYAASLTIAQFMMKKEQCRV